MKRGGSLSFLVGTISNVLVMEIGWTDVGSCAHSNTSCDEGSYMESNEQPGIVVLNVIYQ